MGISWEVGYVLRLVSMIVVDVISSIRVSIVIVMLVVGICN